MFDTLVNMLTRFQVQFKLRAGVKLDDATGVHVGHCPALDLYSQGETKEQAKEALMSAVSLYIRHCFRRNILDDILNRRGFEATDRPRASGLTDGAEFINISQYDDTFDLDVPLDLIQRRTIAEQHCPS